MRIGVDLLGGDRSPEEIYEAALAVDADADVVVFGLEAPGSELEFVPASQEITMEDNPLTALRRKKNASIPIALSMLKEGKLDAFVSTGNTGALIANSAHILRRLPGVERPGLLATLPTLTGSLAAIDIGGNINLKPEHYLQFARMGVAYSQACGIDNPKVGLLNIGTERLKGTQGIRDAYTRLEDSELAFIGNVEGRDAFNGSIDVLVCDGFSGNIFLKTAEGISQFILSNLESAFGEAINPATKQVIEDLNRRVNYAEYPGAILCGIDGVVIKCHGFSSKQAIVNGIKGACRLVSNGLVPRLKSTLQK